MSTIRMPQLVSWIGAAQCLISVVAGEHDRRFGSMSSLCCSIVRVLKESVKLLVKEWSDSLPRSTVYVAPVNAARARWSNGSKSCSTGHSVDGLDDGQCLPEGGSHGKACLSQSTSVHDRSLTMTRLYSMSVGRKPRDD
ncbi:hypothetical protein EJ03DRAFT_167973 [Teratosphaeria nubilosa]|uniref:Uncharacterized protein n=1 Tax=Teratosphaeria nubilosa TaxID=161662 RepID=A0A6G1L1G1_9PEZI|nr:hypothetical protein EJ03DRAFT_167973 [Teratosphaeria nubilosa]